MLAAIATNDFDTVIQPSNQSLSQPVGKSGADLGVAPGADLVEGSKGVHTRLRRYPKQNNNVILKCE